jgi:proline-specific peptidase
MASELPTAEGYIPFKGYNVWYRIVGEREEPGKYPLLTLHGGPGFCHDYLESLDAMAQTGRRVIYYDQLGCGNSDQPHNPDMWTVDLFKEEVGVVRNALGLGRTHLLGQSWGGMLGMEYALTQPLGLLSLTVASSPASCALWLSEANRLLSECPPEVQQAIAEHEAAGTTDDPAYVAAELFFYQRHVCRLDPRPEYVQRSFDKVAKNPEVYSTMQGRSEFVMTGKLKDWDITDRLGEIKVPTLVTSGRYDEATPLIAGSVHRGIPGSEWVIFEESSHMAHAEEAERYMAVLDDFLTRVEQHP